MPPPIVLGLGYGLGLNIKHPTDCAIQALLLLKCAFVEKTNKYFEVRNDVRIWSNSNKLTPQLTRQQFTAVLSY